MRKYWQYFLAVFIIWLVYVCFSLATPLSTTSPYHLSHFALVVLKVSVLLPLLAIWIYSLTGWLHLKSYVESNKDNLEHDAFLKISDGLLVLLIGIILPSIVRGIMFYYNSNLDTSPDWIKFNNYFSLVFTLVSFFIMYLGSVDLIRSVKLRALTIGRSLNVIMPISLFSFFYAALVFTNPARQVPIEPGIPATYYLPDYLIVLTIMLPVIATWILGLLLALNLENYSHKAPTKYKTAMTNFYNGVLAIVGSSILAQALSSLGSTRFSRASLGLLLVLVYVLLVVIALGFGLIARGAKSLAEADTPVSGRTRR